MFFSFSTTPADKDPKAQNQEEVISRVQTIITLSLIGIWFVLISFAVISTANPHWLQELSRPGIDVESRTIKEYGDNLMHRHEFKRAINIYKKALSIKPDFVGAIVNLAIAYMYSNQEQLAEELLKDALNRVVMQKGIIYFNLGLLYERLRRNDEAIECYKNALGSDMEQWLLYRKLGRMYMASNRVPEAAEAFQTTLSIQMDPASGYRDMLYHSLCVHDDNEKHKDRIKNLLLSENWEEALSRFDLEIIRRVNRRDQEIAKTHHNLGVVYSKLGNPELAKKHYDISLKMNLPDTKEIRKLFKLDKERGEIR